MKLLTTMITAAAAILLGALVLSCNVQQKAINTFNKNIGLAAEYCANKFPVKDTVIIRKDSISFDTLVLENMVIDTIHSVYNDTVFQTVTKTLPAKTITKTVTQVKEVVRENTARVKQLELSGIACQQENSELREDNEAKAVKISSLKKERNKWRLYFFILLFVSIGWQTKKLWLKFI